MAFSARLIISSVVPGASPLVSMNWLKGEVMYNNAAENLTPHQGDT